MTDYREEWGDETRKRTLSWISRIGKSLCSREKQIKQKTADVEKLMR